MERLTQKSAFIAGLLGFVLLVGALGMPPALAHAQTLRYGRIPNTSSYYLLPSRGFTGEYPPYDSVTSPSISASCAPAVAIADTNAYVTWYSSATGGTGTYAYTWSGSEGLAGNMSTVQKAYVTTGEKFTTLTVTSGEHIVTVSCGSVRIGPTTITGTAALSSGFGASCYATSQRVAPGESVSWLAIISGVTASTSMSWDGSDSLTGDRPVVSKTYTAPGNKFAMLTVTDGSKRIIAACTNTVTVAPRTSGVPTPSAAPVAPSQPELKGICTPSKSIAVTDEEVFWHAIAIGGTGNYEYLWSGDDELSGEASTTTKQYEVKGIKGATVRITSGDAETDVSCEPLEILKKPQGLLAATILSWISGPVLLILAAMLAGLIGVLIAVRKRKMEEEERDGKEA